MNKTHQNIFGASLALATFSFTYNTYAQTCITPPTCETLGYKMTEAECEGHSFLKCPFDANIGYCDLGKVMSCADGGYSSEKIDGQTCVAISYEGLNCYHCTDKTCAQGGYNDRPITNMQCTKVTYEGLSCYSCYSPCTELPGATYKKPSSYSIKYSAFSYKNSTCYFRCPQIDDYGVLLHSSCVPTYYTFSGFPDVRVPCFRCSGICFGYDLYGPKGAGWDCTTCPLDSNRYKCVEKDCPTGSNKWSCSGSHSGYTLVGYSGDKCCFKYNQ